MFILNYRDYEIVLFKEKYVVRDTDRTSVFTSPSLSDCKAYVDIKKYIII